MQPLPIDPLLPEIVAALAAAPAVVVEAPPGAGKTTRVPRALLDAGLAARGEIVVVQPRRLPARLAAQRVADELGEEVGATVGYTIRFEDVSGPRTRVRFVTEGVLARRLVEDPTLGGISVVVLDEFHERHLPADLALAMLRRLQRGARPDLRLCVMSATLEAAPVRAFLGDCPGIRSEGRRFEVAIEHIARADDRPVHAQVAGAVREILRQEADGDVLVFLPGAGEIRRSQEVLAPLASTANLLVVPLHGDLPPGEQNRAVRRAERRKVILSTNVAETSVTIDGVVAVVDSGLARVAAHSPWSGLPTLTLSRISQASAIQRAGRAGRTRPGRTLRLYTRNDFEGRPTHDLPEVKRVDLADALLALHAVGVDHPAAFPWFEAPAAPALASSEELLARLGAVDGGGRLTDAGRRMLRFPAHPRLGRLIVEGERRGVADEACALAALVAEGDIRERSRASFGPGGGRHETVSSDLLELLDLFQQARAGRGRAKSLGLDGRRVEAAEQARRQLAGRARNEAPRPPGAGAERADRVDEALGLAVLAAFPDRVGRRRKKGGRELVFAAGGSAEIAPGDDELLVAVDVEDRSPGVGAGRASAGAVVRLAVAIKPEWLLDLQAEALRETDELAWNDDTERVERVRRLAYGAIAIDESRDAAPPSPEAAGILADAALARGTDHFAGRGALATLSARLAVVRENAGGAAAGALPALDDEGLRATLAAACQGRRSFAELREAGVDALLAGGLPPDAARLLRTQAPERVTLPGGRSVPVHYEPDRPPWIESRLQDFFGLATGPAVCDGRVPLTIHLLAPNGRAVQVTRDLASFWQKHYPALRRELGRRYPRHAWPQDGRTATPPPPQPPRARRK